MGALVIFFFFCRHNHTEMTQQAVQELRLGVAVPGRRLMESTVVPLTAVAAIPQDFNFSIIGYSP
jgi:hypothetical protein